MSSLLKEMMKRMPDPDSMGQSEYRLVYEFVRELEPDEDEQNPYVFLDSVLTELEESVAEARTALEQAAEHLSVPPS